MEITMAAEGAPKERQRSSDVCQSVVKKRNMKPGRRICHGRIYDSELGYTCHWCRQKTVESHVFCCKCSIKFCGRCLSNRNGEDIHQEMLDNVMWVCPKCRGGCGPGCRNCCNCGPCRKTQGLEPTGITIHRARGSKFSNVHDFLIHKETGESPDVIASRKLGRGWTAGGGALVLLPAPARPSLKRKRKALPRTERSRKQRATEGLEADVKSELSLDSCPTQEDMVPPPVDIAHHRGGAVKCEPSPRFDDQVTAGFKVKQEVFELQVSQEGSLHEEYSERDYSPTVGSNPELEESEDGATSPLSEYEELEDECAAPSHPRKEELAKNCASPRQSSFEQEEFELCGSAPRVKEEEQNVDEQNVADSSTYSAEIEMEELPNEEETRCAVRELLQRKELPQQVKVSPSKKAFAKEAVPELKEHEPCAGGPVSWFNPLTCSHIQQEETGNGFTGFTAVHLARKDRDLVNKLTLSTPPDGQTFTKEVSTEHEDFEARTETATDLGLVDVEVRGSVEVAEVALPVEIVIDSLQDDDAWVQQSVDSPGHEHEVKLWVLALPTFGVGTTIKEIPNLNCPKAPARVEKSNPVIILSDSDTEGNDVHRGRAEGCTFPRGRRYSIQYKKRGAHNWTAPARTRLHSISRNAFACTPSKRKADPASTRSPCFETPPRMVSEPSGPPPCLNVNEFKQQLETVLKERFCGHELKEKLEHLTRRKPMQKERQMRRRTVPFTSSQQGLSYLDYFPDFDSKLSAARDDAQKLTLLRGFFFYIQYLALPGAFKPWVDASSYFDDCMEVRPDCQVVCVRLPTSTKLNPASRRVRRSLNFPARRDDFRPTHKQIPNSIVKAEIECDVSQGTHNNTPCFRVKQETGVSHPQIRVKQETGVPHPQIRVKQETGVPHPQIRVKQETGVPHPQIRFV